MPSEHTYPTAATVLARLADLQVTCSPIEVTIGGTTERGVVRHNVIYVRQAPPAVVKVLVNEYPFVGLSHDGLHITVVASERAPDA